MRILVCNSIECCNVKIKQENVIVKDNADKITLN